jgi:nodulation protein E
MAPPVVGFNTRDPACDLNVVTGAARPIIARHLVQNAFAFGGLNVALAFGI